jgi:uncharacterized membrane protein YedE/YeeE
VIKKRERKQAPRRRRGDKERENFMKNIFKKASWSPYAVGAWIGILSWFTILLFHKALGASTSFVRFFGFLAGIISVDHVFTTPYLSNYVEYKPVFQWQLMLLVGIFIGAFLSAKLSGVTFAQIPYIWGEQFGFSKKFRMWGAMLGGFIILFGARLAGGCVLGHGISGALQLAVSSWIFLFAMFASGITTALVLYRKL